MTISIRTVLTLFRFSFHTLTLTFAASIALTALVVGMKWVGMPLLELGPAVGWMALSLGALGGGMLSFVE